MDTNTLLINSFIPFLLPDMISCFAFRRTGTCPETSIQTTVIDALVVLSERPSMTGTAVLNPKFYEGMN